MHRLVESGFLGGLLQLLFGLSGSLDFGTTIGPITSHSTTVGPITAHGTTIGPITGG